MNNPMLIIRVFDMLKSDLKHLHPSDRLSAAARMAGRPELVANEGFRSAFTSWRRGVAL